MSVPAAYIGVILVWSTTPLAVQWSSLSMSPIAASTLRLGLAWVLVLGASVLLRSPALELRKHWRLYAAASLGLFPSMPLIYSAARYLPSGMIALLFGLSPFFVAVMASRILGDRAMGFGHYLAMTVALGGLALIYGGDSSLDIKSLPGLGLMLLSVAGFSLSSVLVKYYGADANPIRQLNGSLLFAMPGMVLSWLLFDGDIPPAMTLRSAYALVYLAVVGSLLGFVAYLYLLRHMAVTSVAVIPLLTPALALLLGALLNHEPLGPSMLVGTALILLGLGMFHLQGGASE